MQNVIFIDRTGPSHIHTCNGAVNSGLFYPRFSVPPFQDQNERFRFQLSFSGAALDPALPPPPRKMHPIWSL